ncbi:Type 1 glutamine amidotransferase-like domain-containing protein [Treponema zuelzerae]|uniref:Type 1 glutamine amidotransferase-like domain-containing protein n=1 Tax=Teretinema zuelzerae TaxID=156 RepID=A0AAE3EJ72_9SPIR|nr:Type 1 glutamine amidotransferase-like domain-containing protein [Teretinema zuelzerae]MCD1655477.1 Type 1 glutamine amidotransferase-like domain-containing protein [Teretinema zuelzerae]
MSCFLWQTQAIAVDGGEARIALAAAVDGKELSMSRLFLASSFADVSGVFQQWVGEELRGKSVVFIPTASNTEKVVFYVERARKAFAKLGMTIDELDVSTAPRGEIVRKLGASPYIYVSGGNTFFLLQELKRTGADSAILEEVKGGKMYIGESAGSIIASPNIEYAKDMDDCAAAPGLDSYDSLGLVPFYPLPHYTNFPFKKAAEKIIARYDSQLNLRPISNAQAIAVDGGEASVLAK